MIDLDQAECFVELLTGQANTVVVLQVFDDSKVRADKRFARVFIGTVRQHAATLSRANDVGAGIFVQANEGLGRGAKHITAPRAFFADDDAVPLEDRLARGEPPCMRCGEHHSCELPPLITLPPTITVQTSANGRNRHYYWRLRPGEVGLGQWSEVQARIACSLKTDGSLTNVDRVMRLPGTLNRKVDPKKRRDGAPFQVALRAPMTAPTGDAATGYSLAEILDAFPDPAAPPKPNVTIDFGKGIMLDPDGIPIAAPGDLPPLPGVHEPPTPEALRTAERVRQWLTRMQVDYNKRKNRKNPLQFVLKRCVFNSDHLDVMAIMVFPATGALWAGCFHETCGHNSQRWIEVAEKIGGWGKVDSDGFRLGGHAEIAERMLRDLAVGSTEGIVFTNGAFYRYSPLSGVWGAVENAVASRAVQSYHGRQIGDNGRRLVVDHRHVTGAIALAADRASRPDFFESRVDGIAFANGFVRADSEGVRQEPFSPAHRAQVALGVAFDPEAECPRFHRFLDEIFAPDEDVVLKRILLQEFTGAALLGFATRFESALFLTGSGANGKSSWLRIVKALFPPGAISAVRPQDFDNEYYRARLAGDAARGLPPARLNIVAETPEDEIVSAHSFKEIVSGDVISARYPTGRAFEFAPIAAHWFVAQDLPPTRDPSHGFWRKVTVLAFNRVFAPDEQERYLVDYLVESELAGIAAWAAEGARRLVAQGAFSTVASSEAIKKAWQREGDVVLRFVDEVCPEPGPEELPPIEPETDIDALYVEFRAWCRFVGIAAAKTMTKHGFAKRLVRLGWKGRPSNGKRLYQLVVSNPSPTTYDFH